MGNMLSTISRLGGTDSRTGERWKLWTGIGALGWWTTFARYWWFIYIIYNSHKVSSFKWFHSVDETSNLMLESTRILPHAFGLISLLLFFSRCWLPHICHMFHSKACASLSVEEVYLRPLHPLLFTKANVPPEIVRSSGLTSYLQWSKWVHLWVLVSCYRLRWWGKGILTLQDAFRKKAKGHSL